MSADPPPDHLRFAKLNLGSALEVKIGSTMLESTADRVNFDPATMEPSGLLCIESQLAIAVYQGQCASLLVRSDDQLALNAKDALEGLSPNFNTKRHKMLL